MSQSKYYFSKNTALASLETAGYEVVDWFYTYGGLERPVGGRRTHVLKYLRKALFALNRDLGIRLLGGCSLMVLAR